MSLVAKMSAGLATRDISDTHCANS